MTAPTVSGTREAPSQPVSRELSHSSRRCDLIDAKWIALAFLPNLLAFLPNLMIFLASISQRVAAVAQTESGALAFFNRDNAAGFAGLFAA